MASSRLEETRLIWCFPVAGFTAQPAPIPMAIADPSRRSDAGRSRGRFLRDSSIRISPRGLMAK
jgi:hypothetical protein